MKNTEATPTTTHNHFASRDIDPTCDLCKIAQTFRPLVVEDDRHCRNCGSAGHTFCNR